MELSDLLSIPKWGHELRLGNYYAWLHEEHESYHKATIDYIKVQLEYDEDPDADQFSGGWWAVPVPITPEILEKCGFENRYGCTWFYNKLKFTYENNEISQFVRFHYSGKVTYLQYVHQLQNLVYILIHQELVITL